MPDDEASEVGKPRQALAAPEDQQREFNLHLSAQTDELQGRLEEVASASQRESGATATPGDVAGGKDGVSVGGDVFGDIYHVSQSSSGLSALIQKRFNRMRTYTPLGAVYLSASRTGKTSRMARARLRTRSATNRPCTRSWKQSWRRQ